MMDQVPVSQPESKPEPKPEAPKAPGPIGTGIKGNGPPDGFGLGYGAGNGLIGGGSGRGVGGSRFGWYAGEVQTAIQQALQQNPKTRDAKGVITVRIWPDRMGRITRASLANSTGDPALDDAIKNQVLTGLTLQEPPPKDMPLPIVMRITAKRPN